MARMSKELKKIKEFAKLEEGEFLNLEEIEETDELHLLIDTMNNKLFFLEDTRDFSYVLHSIEEIIIICIFGLLANNNTISEIYIFAIAHEEWFKKYLNLDYGIPSISTFRRAIRAIDSTQLEIICNAVFFDFAKELKEMFLYNKQDLKIKDAIDLDGKTCNGSEVNTRDGKVKKTNGMSAYSTKYDSVLATKFIGDKTNEIPTGVKLLKMIDIKDKIVTFDALNTHEPIIKYITLKKGHYVAPIKENNRLFYIEIQEYLDDEEFLKKCSKYTTQEKNHNRLETREYYFTNNIDWLSNKEKWSKIKAIGVVISKHDDVTEKRYFITDLDESYVDIIAKTIRGQWKIENNLHWFLDTVFKEDENHSYTKNSQKNLNIMRKFCLSILKLVKPEFNLSLNLIRHLIATDFERQIERVISNL